MKLTDTELRFLNAVTGGEDLFGVPTRRKKQENGKQNLRKETVKSLMDKGVLISENRLSQQGALPVRALERYKKAPVHLIVNHLRVALTEENSAVLLLPAGEEYDLYEIPTALLSGVIGRFLPFTTGWERRNEKTFPRDGEWRKMDTDSFLKEIYMVRNSLTLGVYRSGRPVQEQLFYEKDGRWKTYDFRMEAVRDTVPEKMIWETEKFSKNDRGKGQ